MKKGKITEKGTHSELLKHYPDGTYAKFVNEQQNAENEESKQNQSQELIKNSINIDSANMDFPGLEANLKEL